MHRKTTRIQCIYKYMILQNSLTYKHISRDTGYIIYIYPFSRGTIVKILDYSRFYTNNWQHPIITWQINEYKQLKICTLIGHKYTTLVATVIMFRMQKALGNKSISNWYWVTHFKYIISIIDIWLNLRIQQHIFPKFMTWIPKSRYI